MCAEKIKSSGQIQGGLFADIAMIKQRLYDKAGISFRSFVQHREGGAYAACTFKLDDHTVEHRSANITPAKQGQFVTIWKRNKEGITAPLDAADDFDMVLITCRLADKIGQFVFPKALLIRQKIIAVSNKGGKRGIRVYPPWDLPANDQALRTQKWQKDYFIDLDDEKAHERILSLFRQVG
ncbi:MepB family protein [Terrimonas sp. NA20]|uniref:MepB family protein n=1 Tax=Terrimonas ginsenosidimutans TaxID=2908004 RepID=A0ABS9KLQ7_9BACT|nr:MepB family protein [Terrimonas ginsenosidimutans]MCG2613244.1 MepB family protein [Terrimonas ginsenosidimutans]